MNTDDFAEIVGNQFRICEDVLVDKNREYATEDVLHNFRVAADLTGESMRKALSGMLAKHTVSIFDMCQSMEVYPLATWNEKITDHINYLILLKAIVLEENGHA